MKRSPAAVAVGEFVNLTKNFHHNSALKCDFAVDYVRKICYNNKYSINYDVLCVNFLSILHIIQQEELMNNKGSLMRRLTRLGTIPALVVGFLLVVLALLAITVSYTTVYQEEAVALAKAYSLAVEGAKGDPAAMTAVIDDVYFGEAGICFVADKNGNVIATSDAEIVPLSVSVADNAAFGEGSKDMDALSARMLAQENDAQHVFIGADDY